MGDIRPNPNTFADALARQMSGKTTTGKNSTFWIHIDWLNCCRWNWCRKYPKADLQALVLVGWKVSLIVASVFGFVEISQIENAPWKTINFRLDLGQLATPVLIPGGVA